MPRPKKITKKHQALRDKFLKEYGSATPMPGVKRNKRDMYKFILQIFKILKRR